MLNILFRLTTYSKGIIGLWALLLLCFPLMSLAAPSSIKVVAAENFYGELAKLIGGRYVRVSSILQNPDQDPHLFTVSPKIARDVTQADVVIYNGLGYDAWIEPLLAPEVHKARSVIVASDILGKKNGDNPHLWYHPDLMPRYATALYLCFIKHDPAHAHYYKKQLEIFLKRYQTLQFTIARLKGAYQATPVIATEPVFEYMAQALDLRMYAQDFQQQALNSQEPSIRRVQEFEFALKKKQVRVLFYNEQVLNSLAEHLITLASAHKIPIVGVTETQPSGISYIEWMMIQLTELEEALLTQNLSSQRPQAHKFR